MLKCRNTWSCCNKRSFRWNSHFLDTYCFVLKYVKGTKPPHFLRQLLFWFSVPFYFYYRKTIFFRYTVCVLFVKWNVHIFYTNAALVLLLLQVPIKSNDVIHNSLFYARCIKIANFVKITPRNLQFFKP